MLCEAHKEGAPYRQIHLFTKYLFQQIKWHIINSFWSKVEKSSFKSIKRQKAMVIKYFEGKSNGIEFIKNGIHNLHNISNKNFFIIKMLERNTNLIV